MTEGEWLAATNAKTMLDYLYGKASDRKLRLFSTACCRSIWDRIADPIHRGAVEVAERHLDGLATTAELGKVIGAVHRMRRKRNRIDWAVYDTVRYPAGMAYSHAGSVADGVAGFVAKEVAPDPSATWHSYFKGDELVSEAIPPNADRLLWDAAYAQRMSLFANFLRCIFGNPFRPLPFDLAWRTPTVVALANGIYDERAFDRMPVLADALEEAGCGSADVLLHCRGSGPHVRGCWVVDAVLGKE